MNKLASEAYTLWVWKSVAEKHQTLAENVLPAPFLEPLDALLKGKKPENEKD